MKTKEIWKLLRGYDRAWSNPACMNLPRLTQDGYLHYREVFQTRMMKALLEEIKQRKETIAKGFWILEKGDEGTVTGLCGTREEALASVLEWYSMDSLPKGWYLKEREGGASMKVGTKVVYSAYPGTVTRVCEWDTDLVEIRLESGDICTDKASFDGRYPNTYIVETKEGVVV